MVLWSWNVGWAVSVGEVANPRVRGGWVTDQAGVLDPTAEAALDARLDALSRDLGAQVAVVTVDTVSTATPKDFATALFQRWGIGEAGQDDGLLVLLVLDQHRLEMETGYGLEPILTDAWEAEVQAREMVPRFRTGDFAGGLEAGIAAVDQELRAHPDEVRAALEPPRSPLPAIGGGVAAVLVSIGGAALGGLAFRRRRRTCPKCGVYMPKLDEASDDAHLSEGQQVEEQIGSVDYQVHQCPRCGEVRTFARMRWFSGHDRCDRCQFRTRTTHTQTLVAATTMSGGRVRVDESCANCSYRASYERRTPPLQTSTGGGGGGIGGGGGGSSGGSFGGGHSGGGGAGSSW